MFFLWLTCIYIYRERVYIERDRERNKSTNKKKIIKNNKNIKEIPETTVIETKDQIKSKTKQQPQQQTKAVTYNENKKIYKSATKGTFRHI